MSWHLAFSWPVVITHWLLLVAVGLAFEVVFTASLDFLETRDRRLLGYTYLWMIPVYMIVYPACWWLYPKVAAWPWLARGLFYTALIFAVEYASGWLIRKAVGKCPWEDGYYKARWGVHGLIRLDFTPAWVAASLVYEWVFRVLRGLV